jgi:hypothetical protein
MKLSTHLALVATSYGHLSLTRVSWKHQMAKILKHASVALQSGRLVTTFVRNLRPQSSTPNLEQAGHSEKYVYTCLSKRIASQPIRRCHNVQYLYMMFAKSERMIVMTDLLACLISERTIIEQ